MILVAGLAVYVAAEGRAGLYSAADSADSLGDQFQVLEAAEGVNLLLGVQVVLAANPLACSTAPADVAAEVGALSGLQNEANVTVASRAAVVDSAAAYDGDPALRPYNGTVPGDLDLALVFTGSGSSGPGVTLSRTETRYAHLGLRLDMAVQDCTGAVAAIEDALSGSSLPGCNSSAGGAALQAATRGPASTAAADGFRFGVSYSVTDPGSCQVSFQVTLEQPGIQGPGGPFSVLFEEGGSASPLTPVA